MKCREDRIRPSSSTDPRKPFQRDRDRVLYSPEFRRLSGVTQVASAGEGDVFHNRLTHSLKVAQVGRRLAERLQKPENRDLIEAWGGLDPDVVETAALAHDLGHPPFGHDGEQVIGEFVENADSDRLGGGADPDGFEGNAQSFRIVTRLAAHTDSTELFESVGRPVGNSGLNLTRATLNAILKYPWLRSESGEHRRKWGAYVVDADRFMWAREGWTDERRSLEAELMNWADDVTYAVHDLEDFFRAGLVPIHRLVHRPEQERFLDAASKRKPRLARRGNDLEKALSALFGPMRLLDTPYDGGRRQRTLINAATSSLISQFITGKAIGISDPSQKCSVTIHPDISLQVELLREVTHYYVISHPRVVSVREGQREMLRKLFEMYVEVLAGNRNRALLPQATIDRLDSGDGPRRLVADLLTGMTERQVIQTYQRFMGMGPSPVTYFDL